MNAHRGRARLEMYRRNLGELRLIDLVKSSAIFAWIAFLALPLLETYSASEMIVLAACFVLKAID